MPSDPALADAPDAVLPSFTSVLARVVTALNGAEVPFGVIGGVASAAYGRPRCTKDIDVFCRPEEAERVLEVLDGESFTVEQTNPAWIFKAWSDDVVVDVIFKARGEIYFDDEMRARVAPRELWGVEVPLVAPEDIVVMKVLAMDETTPGHWWDALCILATNDLDWAYLLERARKGPNRVASLLHFALSTDVVVPTSVVLALDEQIAQRWTAAPLEDRPWTNPSPT